MKDGLNIRDVLKLSVAAGVTLAAGGITQGNGLKKHWQRSNSNIPTFIEKIIPLPISLIYSYNTRLI